MDQEDRIVALLGTRQDPHVQAAAARSQPLLLHSIALFREIFEILFDHRQISTVVEVGVETGQVSDLYAELGAEDIYCIEPAPTAELRAQIAENPALHLVESHSPGAFAELPLADLYVLDGDHNYATVRAELDWILEHAPNALIVFHDVLWPCSRRDLYYEPSVLTAAQRHTSSEDGPTVWHDGVTPSGFVGCGAFTVATEAGGDRNGVLTAIEDAVAHDDNRRIAIVPAVFGLGLLVRTDTASDIRLLAALRPYTHSDLLAAMENNRIALYTRVLSMQAEMAAHAQEADRLVLDLAARKAENDELRRENEALSERNAREIGRLHCRIESLGRQLEDQRRLAPALRNLAGASRDLLRRAGSPRC